MVETVKDNKKFYTKREFDKAQRARTLMKSLGFPTTDDLRSIIRMNSIMNNPVTLQDVDLADRIFGKDAAYLKGKSTRKKSPVAVDHTIEVPKELYEHQNSVDLCIDAVFINGQPFLSTISKRIMYRTCMHCPTREIEVYRSALLEVF